MSNIPFTKTCFKLIRNAVIVLSVTALLLAIVEGALRVLPVDIDGGGVKAPLEPACEFHPEYLIKLRANVVKSYPLSEENGGRDIHWRTNSLGFRGPELRDNPGLRVIVYGDSNIQARFSEHKDTFAFRLEAELTGMLDRDVEVVNAGVLGFGPDQSFLKFKEEADMLKPDLVIMHFFADNDYGDVIRNRLFDLSPGGRLTKSVHERVADIVIAERGPLSGLAITRFIKKMKTGRRQRSFLIEDVQAPQKALEEFKIFKEGRAREYSHFDDLYDWPVAFTPGSEDSTIKVKLVEEIFKSANGFAALKGIRFMVLIEPSARDLTENVTPNYKSWAAREQYSPKNLTGLAEAALKRNDIEGINLFDIFFRSDPSKLFFSKTNDHWNDRGQALAAKESAAYIVNRRLLE